MKLKTKYTDIIMIGLALAGSYFLLNSVHAFGDEIPSAEEEIALYYNHLHSHRLTGYEYDFAMTKYKQHQAAGEQLWTEAQIKAWYCPNIAERDKAKYCFEAVFAGITAGNPWSKAMAMCTVLMLNYGLDCMDEWNVIQTDLHWAEYHFEMAEHYIRSCNGGYR
jgi:hypothetical protein